MKIQTLCKNLLLLIAFALGITSCDDCRDSECPGDGFKRIKYSSATDGEDLFDFHQYSLDSLDITPLLINESEEVPEFAVFRYDSGKYIISVIANENTKGFVLSLDSLPPDTLLAITGQTAGDDCCGSVTTFDTAILNGDTLPNGNEDVDIVIIK